MRVRVRVAYAQSGVDMEASDNVMWLLFFFFFFTSVSFSNSLPSECYLTVYAPTSLTSMDAITSCHKRAEN